MKAKIAFLLGLALLLVPFNAYAADIYGDVNNDGVVDAQDSAYVLNNVLNSSFEIDEVLADADGDGEITAADSTMILQKVLLSTYKLAKEKENPDVGLVSEISDLPYGVYTKSFKVGGLTVSASKSAPVYVKDVCIETTSDGEKTYEKTMVMTKGSGFSHDMQKGLYSFNIGFLLINGSDYAADVIAPCDKNGTSLESAGYYSEQDENYEHIWESWNVDSMQAYWKNSSDKPVLIQSAKMIAVR